MERAALSRGVDVRSSGFYFVFLNPNRPPALYRLQRRFCHFHRAQTDFPI
jgi:hypothetical protein